MHFTFNMQCMEINVPETRGQKAKYDFCMDVGDSRKYENVTTNSLLTAAKFYCTTRGLLWKFRCYKMDGFTHIVRVS